MKTIVVTGANRGIGLEISRQLAEMSHRLVMAVRNPAKSQAALAKIQALSPESMMLQLDLGDSESIKTFAEELSQLTNHLDVLVNNAAILEDSRESIRSIDEELMIRMMEVNFWGAFRLTRAMLPLLDKSSDPRIINLSSGRGELSNIAGGYPAYRMSKTAINGLTVRLAADEPHIKTNSVCPGWVRTDMGGSSASRPVEKGAETPVWLATADNIPTGKFLRDKTVIEW